MYDKFTSHLSTSYSPTEPEDLPAPIDIQPLDVKMTESSAHILYLPSSMRPSAEAPMETSPNFSPDLPSTITVVSTLVDPLSAYSSVTPCDDTDVNLLLMMTS